VGADAKASGNIGVHPRNSLQMCDMLAIMTMVTLNNWMILMWALYTNESLELLHVYTFVLRDRSIAEITQSLLKWLPNALVWGS